MKQRVISGVIIAILIIALGLLGGTFLAIPIMLQSAFCRRTRRSIS